LLDLAKRLHTHDKGSSFTAGLPPNPGYLCEAGFWRMKHRAGENILKHGIYHSRKGLGVDESVMWGIISS
jgi:hypothetical protein